MLASVIPGLREIRAPLAAGYLWLLCAWLALSDAFPSEQEATGIYAAVFDLRDAVSAVGVAIVLSAAAYLVGAISEGLLGGLWRSQLGFGGVFYTPAVRSSWRPSARGASATTERRNRRAARRPRS